jgi:hypothetical protein
MTTRLDRVDDGLRAVGPLLDLNLGLWSSENVISIGSLNLPESRKYFSMPMSPHWGAGERNRERRMVRSEKAAQE